MSRVRCSQVVLRTAMRRQSLNLLTRVLGTAREQEALCAVAAPALRQYSSLISLQSIPSQQWTSSRSQTLHQQCFQQAFSMPEGHRLYTTGSIDLTPEPRVSPGFPAVPTELDEDTVASIVAGSSSSPFSVPALLKAAQVGELAALEEAYEGSWFISKGFQRLLDIVHNGTASPWWLTILYTTLAARTLTLPLVVKQHRGMAQMSMARPEMEKLREWFNNETARGNESAAAEYKQRLSDVWKKYDANPFTNMLGGLAQAPIFIGFFSAIRAMACAKIPSMTVGGALWFTDLTIADPYYLLPITASAIFLLTVELGAADGMQGQDEVTMKRMKMAFRALGVAMVPLTASMPQGVFIYWCTSNVFSLAQSLLFKVPSVRTFLKLPQIAKLRAVAAGQPTDHVGKPVVTFAQKPNNKKAKAQA